MLKISIDINRFAALFSLPVSILSTVPTLPTNTGNSLALALHKKYTQTCQSWVFLELFCKFCKLCIFIFIILYNITVINFFYLLFLFHSFLDRVETVREPNYSPSEQVRSCVISTCVEESSQVCCYSTFWLEKMVKILYLNRCFSLLLVLARTNLY